MKLNWRNIGLALLWIVGLGVVVTFINIKFIGAPPWTLGFVGAFVGWKVYDYFPALTPK